jgi:hypothetical protein
MCFLASMAGAGLVQDHPEDSRLSAREDSYTPRSIGPAGSSLQCSGNGSALSAIGFLLEAYVYRVALQLLPLAPGDRVSNRTRVRPRTVHESRQLRGLETLRYPFGRYLVIDEDGCFQRGRFWRECCCLHPARELQS